MISTDFLRCSVRQMLKAAVLTDSQASPSTKPPIVSDRKWTPRPIRDAPMHATHTKYTPIAQGRQRLGMNGMNTSRRLPYPTVVAIVCPDGKLLPIAWAIG